MSKNFKDSNSQKKTVAKRIGIKSVLLHGDNKLTITTFGKGNATENAIKTDTQGSDLAQTFEPRNLTAEKILKVGKDRGIKMRGTAAGNYLDTIINNPAEVAGEDYLKLKSQLEIEFFGKEFPNDNTRIQIIHNILDIQKILGLYIADIIYSVNNLQDSPEDIVGLSMSDKNIDDRLNRIVPYLGFFGDAFRVPPKIAKGVYEKLNKINEKEISLRDPSTPRFKQENIRLEINTLKKEFKEYEKYKKEYEKAVVVETYNKSVLRLLGACRQCTAHFKDDNSIFFLENQKLKKVLEKKYNKVDWDIIEKSYVKRTESINEKFLDHSKTNLRILFDIFSNVEQDEIIEEYFRFSILKEGKNLGLNMTHLREVLLDKLQNIKGPKYDSCRSKIYRIIDYILFRQIRDTDGLADMVAKLRGTQNEEEKEILYQNFAEEVWQNTEQYIVPFYDKFASGAYPAFDSTPLNTQLDKSLQKLTVSDIPFVQILAFLCNFLDGKEINELLSAYIHKFENIQSFIDTLNELGETVRFTPTYELFNDSGNVGKIAQQLRFIISIGKMKGDLSDAKRPLFKAAIRMLGIEKLDIEHDEEKFNKWLEENVLTGDKNKKKDCNPFRNFIAKQVIESNRFIYLVRYTKPQTVRALMQNRHIVHYVLSRLPEEQVNKYYERIDNGDKKELSKKIDALTDKLSTLSFKSLVDSKGRIKDASSQPGKRNVEIEKLKGLVGLYLTTAFVAVKNLVKANARYYIAFAAFDRDHSLFTEKLGLNKKTDRTFFQTFTYIDEKDGKQKEGIVQNYFSLTKYFLDRDDKVRYVPDPNLSEAENKRALFKFIDTRAGKWHFTKKWNTDLRNNISGAERVHKTGYLLTSVRNHAEHLNVMMNLAKYVDDFRKNNDKPMQSYFELYHYILQRMMIESANSDGFNIEDFADKVTKYNTPSHDWIKYAYVSLAYNLPRYKNLTIEALFDEDSESGKELTAKWKQK